jgi:ribosomal protein S12 methylthiotransferase
MARQQAISKRRLARKVGTRQQVIIDEVGPTVARGRSKGDAPEIDSAVKIERAEEYDLYGTAVGF